MVIILGYVKEIGRNSSKRVRPTATKKKVTQNQAVLITVPGDEDESRLEMPTLAGPISKQQKMKNKV
jgi:hypothetical protein